MIIEGGTGNGYSVKVTRDNQLVSYSTIVSELAFISYLKQDGYTMVSALTNIATGSCIMFFRNTDPARNFHVHKIIIGSTIASQFTVYINNTYAASTGTAIVPVNLNGQSGKVALCTCLGTVAVATVTPGKKVLDLFTSANVSQEFFFEGSPIFGLNNDFAIVVTNASSTNIIAVTVTGYYKDITL